MSFTMATNACIAFCSYVFKLFFSLALHTKCPYFEPCQWWSFSNTVHVFRNLFWKTCPLFEQILITCLKCSWVSFSPSSYSEKMRWGQGWTGTFLFSRFGPKNENCQLSWNLVPRFIAVFTFSVFHRKHLFWETKINEAQLLSLLT